MTKRPFGIARLRHYRLRVRAPYLEVIFMINQDAIPRIIGLAIASMGLATLWVVGVLAWGVAVHLYIWTSHETL